MTAPHLRLLAGFLLLVACGSEPAPRDTSSPTTPITPTAPTPTPTPTPTVAASPEHDRCLTVLAAAAGCRDYHGFVEDSLPSSAEASAGAAAKERLVHWAELAGRERECGAGVDAWVDRGGDAAGDGDDAPSDRRDALERAARDADCERLASAFQHAGGFPPPPAGR